MAKATQSNKEDYRKPVAEKTSFALDSRYRLIIVAAQRSKQLQRGAHARVEIDNQQHKHTRVALSEVEQGKVDFMITVAE